MVAKTRRHGSSRLKMLQVSLRGSQNQHRLFLLTFKDGCFSRSSVKVQQGVTEMPWLQSQRFFCVSPFFAFLRFREHRALTIDGWRKES